MRSGLMRNLSNKLADAAKSKGKLRLAAIKMVKSSIKNIEIAAEKPLSDAKVVDFVGEVMRQRFFVFKLSKVGGRKALAAKEKAEIKILEEFLPSLLSREEIQSRVKKVVKGVKASGLKNLGEVMGKVMPLVSKRASGGVDPVVKEMLITF